MEWKNSFKQLKSLRILEEAEISMTDSHVNVHLKIQSIHLLPKALIKVNFQPRSLEVKINEPCAPKWYKIQRLNKCINVKDSSFTVETDVIKISMKKDKEEKWIFIHDVNEKAFTDCITQVSQYVSRIGYFNIFESVAIVTKSFENFCNLPCWRHFAFSAYRNWLSLFKDLEEVFRDLEAKFEENLNGFHLIILMIAKQNKDFNILVLETEKGKEKSTKKSPLTGKKRLAEDFKNEGNEYFRNKRFKEAVEAYKKAIELDPDCAVHYLNSAYAHYYLGNLELSLEHLCKSLELEPFYAKQWLLRTKLALSDGKYKESLHMVHIAKFLDPFCQSVEREHKKVENLGKYSLLYIESFKAEKKDEATMLKQKLFKLNSREAVYKILFEIMVDKDLLDLAKEEALSLMNFNTHAGFKLLSEYYLIKGDEVGLKENLEQILKTVNNNENQYCCLIYSFYKNALEFKNKGDKCFEKDLFGEAIEWYLKVLELSYQVNYVIMEVNFKIGCSKFNLNEIDEAVTYFTHSLQPYQISHATLAWKGRCHLRQKNFIEALSDFQLANHIEPSEEYRNLIKIAENGGIECSEKVKKTDFDCTEPVKKTDTDCRDAIREKEITLQKNLSNCKKERGNICYKNGDYDEAAKLYSEAIELDDDNPLLYSNRSACYLALKKFSDALADCDRTLKRDPQSVKGLFRLGKCYLATGETDKALQSFEEALKISKDDKICEEEMERVKCLEETIENGKKEFKRNRYAKAESFFSEALLTAEGCLEVHLKKLECLSLQEKYKELLSSALLAESLFPHVSKICYFISLGYFYEDEEMEGKKYLEKYKDLNFSSEKSDLSTLETLLSVEGMKAKGDEFYNKNELDEAFDQYSSAKDLVPTKTRLFSVLSFKIGLVLRKKDEVANAIPYFSSSIDSQSDFVDAYIKRGECFMKCNMVTEAVKNYERLNNVSSSESHRKLLLEAEEKLRNNCEHLSEEDMEYALSQIKSAKAEKLLEEGKYEEAVKMYSNALHFNPESAKNYAKRSFCFIRLNDYDEAFDDAKRSVQLDSECLEGLLNLGNCFLAFGDVARSRESFKKAQELEKSNKNAKTGLSKCVQLEKCLKGLENSLKNGNFEKGLRQIESASKMASVCASLLLDKAECLIGLHRLDDVLHLMNKAPSNMKDKSEILCIKGLYYYHKDERSEAVSHLLRGTERDARNKKIKQKYDAVQKTYDLKQKGDDSFVKGNWSQSLKFYSESLKCAAGNAELEAKLHYNIGVNNIKMNNNSNAIKCFSRALELKRDYLKPLEKRAECYKRMKDSENALKDYEELYRLSNEDKYSRICEEIEEEVKKTKSKDHYKTLRVSRDASMEEIRVSYKRLAKEFHPDKAGSEEERVKGEEKFKEISVAYSVLSDPLKRERYDRGEDEDEDVFPGFHPFFQRNFMAEFMFRNMFFNRFDARNNDPFFLN